MNDLNQIKINPNTVDLDTLTQIPGIGTELAQRMVAARPFEKMEDLRRVSGIGPALLERILPYLFLEDPEIEVGSDDGDLHPEESIVEALHIEQTKTEEPALEGNQDATDGELVELFHQAEVDVPAPAENQDEEVDADGALKMEKETPALQPAAIIEKPITLEKNWVTRGQAFGMMFVSFLLALVLGVLLSLGILAGINQGRLQFANPSHVNSLMVQAGKLDDRASTIEQDIQGVRSRIENIEMLGSRITEIEKSTEQSRLENEELTSQLAADLGEVSSQVSDLEAEVSDFGTQVERLTSQGERFDGFLEGLQTLIAELINPQDGSE